MKQKIFLFVSFIFILNPLFSLDKDTVQQLDTIYSEKERLNRLNQEKEKLTYLLEKKEKIENLYSNGNTEEVNSMFEKDKKTFLKSIEKDEKEEINSNWYTVKVCYKNILPLEDDILLMKSELQKYKQEKKAQILTLEKITSEYPNSNSFAKAAEELLVILAETERFEQYIDLYETGDFENDNYLKFLYSQALYESGYYNKAKENVVSLKDVPNYNNRVVYLLGLINLSLNNPDSAIDYFETYQNKIEIDEPFVLLTLARLYSSKKQFTKSLQTYKAYVDLRKNSIEQEIIYEIAYIYYFKEQYSDAKQSLEIILENPDNYDLYNSAKILYAIVLQNEGFLANANTTIEEELTNIKKIIELLNDKNQLLNNIKIKVDDFGKTTDENKKNKYIADIRESEEKLNKINSQIKDYSHGLAKKDLKILNLLEDKIVTLNEDIIRMAYLINYLNTTPNEEKTELVNLMVKESRLNKSIVKALYYCANLETVTNQDFQVALQIVFEKEKSNDLISLTNEIIEANYNQEIKDKAVLIKENMTETIASLNLLGEYYFNSNDKNKEIKEEIKKEIELIDKRTNSLKQLKELVYNKYNKKIAKKQIKEFEELLAQSKSFEEEYVKFMDSLKEENIENKQKYDYSLLKLLFNETLAKDKQFESSKD